MTVRVVYADGPQAPRTRPDDALAIAGLTGPIDLQLGWTVERPDWLNDPELRGRTFMAGYGLSRAINEGRFIPLPVRLSAVPSLLATRPPDLAVVTGVPRGSGFALSTSVGWGDAAALAARSVVIEVDHDADDLGAPMIVGNIVGTVPRPAASASPGAAQRGADAIDAAIGELVVSLIPDEPTLQFGPGGIGEGIANALDKPVRIWSGLVTEAMAALADRHLLAAPATAAYGWGGEPVSRLARAGLLELRPVSWTHDLTRMSSIPRFVGCNTALQVGLDGSVNIERVGGRTITSIGGHADFCAGASRSVGGLSVIALRSTDPQGESTIVAEVETVSTPRCDVQAVVTEHGIADLRGLSDDERALRIIAIAAPQFRDRLSAALTAAKGARLLVLPVSPTLADTARFGDTGSG